MTENVQFVRNRLPLKGFIAPYIELTKPVISLVVTFTALGGLSLANFSQPAAPSFSLSLWIATLVGTFLSSASASVFNQVLDSDIDGVMERTKKRPLPKGSLSNTVVVVYGAALMLVATIVLLSFTNVLTFLVALGGHLFYTIIYTKILKRSTVQNIVIGGAAGSVGPLIGWAAVQNNLSWEAWSMFLLVFLWTPPHFWALALKYSDDYKQAGIPMYPWVKGIDATKKMIWLYTISLQVLLGIMWATGVLNFVTTLICSVFTLYFMKLAYTLNRSAGIEGAMRVFFYSCLYILIIFFVIALEPLIM